MSEALSDNSLCALWQLDGQRAGSKMRCQVGGCGLSGIVGPHDILETTSDDTSEKETCFSLCSSVMRTYSEQPVEVIPRQTAARELADLTLEELGALSGLRVEPVPRKRLGEVA